MSHDTLHRPQAAGQRDTLLGVCQAIGDAAGIDPLFLRLGFVLALFAASFPLTVFAYVVAAITIRLARA